MPFYKSQLFGGVFGEVNLMIYQIGTARTAHETEEARVRSSSQGYDLFVPARIMVDELLYELINGLRTDIGTFHECQNLVYAGAMSKSHLC